MELEALKERIGELNRQLARGIDTLDPSVLQRVSGELSDVKDAVREKAQEVVKGKVKPLIKHIKKGTLSDEDYQLLRELLVGESEHYLKSENNFDDWVEEVRRLVKVLSSYESKPAYDTKTLYELSGTLTDLDNTLLGIVRYLQAKQYVKQFENATKDRTIPSESRAVLIDIIKTKMRSPEV